MASIPAFKPKRSRIGSLRMSSASATSSPPGSGPAATLTTSPGKDSSSMRSANGTFGMDIFSVESWASSSSSENFTVLPSAEIGAAVDACFPLQLLVTGRSLAMELLRLSLPPRTLRAMIDLARLPLRWMPRPPPPPNPFWNCMDSILVLCHVSVSRISFRSPSILSLPAQRSTRSVNTATSYLVPRWRISSAACCSACSWSWRITWNSETRVTTSWSLCVASFCNRVCRDSRLST
mmetsp:Transcript_36228/g.84935  ORF Transcript_36228/g.84935 Transcript_36228/m.84935 type:complete len:236 (+) Transcript_36228:136-843(+)